VNLSGGFQVMDRDQVMYPRRFARIRMTGKTSKAKLIVGPKAPIIDCHVVDYSAVGLSGPPGDVLGWYSNKPAVGSERFRMRRKSGLRLAAASVRFSRCYSAACDDGRCMVTTPSASVAEIVVRTISRASCAGHGRPRCMVARLSHITTSPPRHWCR